MRYSVLVADDEAPIRRGLLARLRHLQFQPEAVYEAVDGADALAQIRLHQPDIVFTDIRMPVLDGLDFIRQARAAAPATAFVILSGYTEFAYAEQAIHLGVHAYLVKPLSNDALAQVMNALLEKLALQARVRAALERAEDEDWRLERQVNDLLTGAEGAGACSRLSSFQRPGSRYLLALLSLAVDFDPSAPMSASHAGAARQAVLACHEDLNGDGRALMAGNPADRSQLFLLLRDEDAPGLVALARLRLERLTAALRDKGSRLTLTVGVSEPFAALCPEMLRQAQEALYRRMTHGCGHTYWYADLPQLEDGRLPHDELALLQRRMDSLDLDGVEALLRELFGRAKAQAMPPAFFRFLWMRTANLLLEVAGVSLSDQMERMLLDFGDLKRFDSTETMCAALFERVAAVLSGGRADDLDGAGKIRRALKYIDENYPQSLSVNGLSALYGLSPNYFSALFRRETGVNVVAYIRNVRMERACALLRETGESVVDIAARVGYSDSQYFFRLFRKELGLSPLQYRKRSRATPPAGE